MDARIMHINGNSHQFAHPRTADSYYCSHALCSWGWATWIVGLGDVAAGLAALRLRHHAVAPASREDLAGGHGQELP